MPASSPPTPEEVRSPAAAATVAPPPARSKATPEAATAQLEQWQLLAAGQLADEHFGPAELATLLCQGERTLYRRLGELVGLTPAAWRRELRLNQAWHLLGAEGLGSVAAVADTVGFASPQIFCCPLRRALWPPPQRLPGLTLFWQVSGFSPQKPQRASAVKTTALKAVAGICL